MIDLEGLIVGDELLVDGNSYTGGGNEWARLTRVSPGSASVYPYKVALSNGAEGQYAAREIQGRRRPEHLRAALADVEASSPGHLEKLVADAVWPR